jgi:hypothetical protein
VGFLYLVGGGSPTAICFLLTQLISWEYNFLFFTRLSGLYCRVADNHALKQMAAGQLFFAIKIAYCDRNILSKINARMLLVKLFLSEPSYLCQSVPNRTGLGEERSLYLEIFRGINWQNQ